MPKFEIIVANMPLMIRFEAAIDEDNGGKSEASKP